MPMPLTDYHHLFEAETNLPAVDSSKVVLPPLLLLHGTGGDEHDLLPLGRALSPGSALLSLRGNVSEHGAPRFFARLGEGRFDPAEVTRRTHELADFIADATKRYGLDSTQLIAIGFSNGANIAATLLQLRPESLGGAVLLRPMVVLDQAARTGTLTGIRVLIASGTQDPIVPNDHPSRLAALLRTGGAEVTLHMSAAGHGLVTADVTAAKKFLADR
ncbi:MAG: alpha/beta hydrolase [Opitutaceae bacterium]